MDFAEIKCLTCSSSNYPADSCKACTSFSFSHFSFMSPLSALSSSYLSDLVRNCILRTTNTQFLLVWNFWNILLLIKNKDPLTGVRGNMSILLCVWIKHVQPLMLNLEVLTAVYLLLLHLALPEICSSALWCQWPGNHHSGYFSQYKRVLEPV